jgi:recombination protein RecA
MSRAQQLAKEVNRFLGTEALVMGSSEHLVVDYISTGLLPIDVLFGGGLPRGRYVELTGSYSTLKSYIGLTTVREIQQAGGVAAIIDTEHTYDPQWAASVGVNTNDLLLWPNMKDRDTHTGEEAVDVAEVLIRNDCDLIVFDSIAATLPQAEAERRLHKEAQQMARQAALMSKAFRKLTAANSRTAVLFINQMRDQVGVTFGPTERAPGGRAAGFYASLRVNIRPAGKVTRDVRMFTGEKYQTAKEMVAQTYRAIVEKSKLNKPWREIYFDWNLERNQVDVEKFLFTQGVDLGLVTNKGNSWLCGNVRVVGKANFLTRLSSDAELRMELENQVRNHHGLPLLGVPAIPRRKAGVLNMSSSDGRANGRTRGQGQVASGSMARTPRKSLK